MRSERRAALDAIERRVRECELLRATVVEQQSLLARVSRYADARGEAALAREGAPRLEIEVEGDGFELEEVAGGVAGRAIARLRDRIAPLPAAVAQLGLQSSPRKAPRRRGRGPPRRERRVGDRAAVGRRVAGARRAARGARRAQDGRLHGGRLQKV